MTAEEIAQKMYQLACSFGLRSGSNVTNISVQGLNENLPQAMKIVEDLAYNAVPDENILANLKADMLKSRSDAKLKLLQRTPEICHVWSRIHRQDHSDQ